MSLFYTQCKLKRGTQEQIAWVPSAFAGWGRVLKYKEDGVWHDYWAVWETYSTRSQKDVETHERDYLHQRRASDI